jgi:hypothetical protein
MEYDEWLFKPKLWADGIPLWQYWLALHDERMIEDMEQCYDKVIALRRFDELQISGCLEQEKSQIKSMLAANKAHVDLTISFAEIKNALTDARDYDTQLGYLFDGLKSPDEAERNRYRKARDWIKTHHGNALLYELAPILSVIAKPKQKAGRKEKKRPSDEDHEWLVKMKILIAGGMAIETAARQVSEGAVKQQSQLATQKRLAAWWRWKMAMREFPPEFKSPLNFPSTK